MEFWYAATGPYHWQAVHETHMQSQPFYIQGIAPNGQLVPQMMNGILEPVRIYRYIFPKEGLNLVLNTFAAYKNDKLGMNIMAATFRKMLGLMPIPEHVPIPQKLNASFDHINVIPLGIKDDVERIIQGTGVKQEAI